MNKLKEILDVKREEVEAARKRTPPENLRARQSEIRDFSSALDGRNISVIAEIKRRSPSRGDLRMDTDPVDIALSYERHGAAAISVLTDSTYFAGDLDLVRRIREYVALPVLRKDFIIDEYQVWESYHAGADAILLILDAFSGDEAENLYSLATGLGMHVLVEAYREESLEQIAAMRPVIAGINARDLGTLELDFTRMLRRRNRIPDDSIAVAESGVTSPDHLKQVVKSGYDAVLIGTAFMCESDPGDALSRYLGHAATEAV